MTYPLEQDRTLKNKYGLLPSPYLPHHSIVSSHHSIICLFDNCSLSRCYMPVLGPCPHGVSKVMGGTARRWEPRLCHESPGDLDKVD